MPTILVTGAASGIGAAFVDAYQASPDNNIIAVDRHRVEHAAQNVDVIEVDVRNEASVQTLAHRVGDRPLDLVIHSAGVRGLVPAMESSTPGNVAACETRGVMDAETLTRAFQVNTVGTFLVLRALLPNLRRTAGKVVVMSSRMGSIGNNEHPNRAAGSAYAYRASKAAQNMIVRSLAADEQDITFVLCHPGRVESKLVKWREEDAISARESVEGMLPLIQRWSKQDSGMFYDRFGDRVEW
ncbi:hypothetical protein CERZMDRAFT_100610 [Cercospora zeae-maydis SCOH1-5]|uniref:Ketoreductase domain-containing protein n=1 Tax=Cercospora zeae-maydis SCOH1-5 TaxID=717836 RepID=A0A6A6F7V6_9PEZI|nr:hypothetical protein CERZMDRAFT_100610 [Cercospora zeae-maydis SCOH1-5]